MKPIKYNPIFWQTSVLWLIIAYFGLTATAWSTPEEITLEPQYLITNVTLPQIKLKSPVPEYTLQVYSALPAKLYFNASLDNSYRLETNPFQVKAGTPGLTQGTSALRIQTQSTVGWAFTPKTRLSVGSFMLRDEFHDRSPYKLDSTIFSLSTAVEHDWVQSDKWQLSSQVALRQLYLPKDRGRGSILPSVTGVRQLGQRGWTYANAAFDIGGTHHPFNTPDNLTQLYTWGAGYQFPVNTHHHWQQPLSGVTAFITTSYAVNHSIQRSRNQTPTSQSIVVSAEVAKPVKPRWPVLVYLRAEPIFNFGTEQLDPIGKSGINFRLFTGIRTHLNKAPLSLVNLSSNTDSDTPLTGETNTSNTTNTQEDVDTNEP